MEQLGTEPGVDTVLTALITCSIMETGSNPGILSVETVSPDVATQMRLLGYSELSPALLVAMIQHGTVSTSDVREAELISPEIHEKFLAA